jgi:hypothetical protein
MNRLSFASPVFASPVLASPVFAFFFVVASLAGLNAARAEETDAQPFGIGYKIGNGIGVLGADAIVRAIPYVSLDLQANYLYQSVTEGYSGTTATATGYGIAPTLQAQLKPIGHTPYLGLGFAYVHLSLNGATGAASALLVNAGYEWRFASGVGILVGAGIADIGSIHAMSADGSSSISEAGGMHFNLEAGVRYYFPVSKPAPAETAPAPQQPAVP